jgi:hypothetical protein
MFQKLILPALLGSDVDEKIFGSICCSTQIECQIDSQNTTRIVSISLDQGFVDLFSNKHILKGEIPPEMEALTALHTLQLQRNSISGVLPSVQLPVSLVKLSLANNPNLIGYIPQSYENLKNIQLLNLENTCLYGQLPWKEYNLREGYGSNIGTNFCLRPDSTFPNYALGSATPCTSQILVPQCAYQPIESSSTQKVTAMVLGSFSIVAIILVALLMLSWTRLKKKFDLVSSRSRNENVSTGDQSENRRQECSGYFQQNDFNRNDNFQQVDGAYIQRNDNRRQDAGAYIQRNDNLQQYGGVHIQQNDIVQQDGSAYIQRNGNCQENGGAYIKRNESGAHIQQNDNAQQDYQTDNIKRNENFQQDTYTNAPQSSTGQKNENVSKSEKVKIANESGDYSGGIVICQPGIEQRPLSDPGIFPLFDNVETERTTKYLSSIV